MKSWIEYVRNGLNGVRNDYGRVRNSSTNSIVFPNGYVASILPLPTYGWYSVAACDWNGYFDWDIFPKEDLSPYGGRLCKTEDEVCAALDVISNLPPITN